MLTKHYANCCLFTSASLPAKYEPLSITRWFFKITLSRYFFRLLWLPFKVISWSSTVYQRLSSVQKRTRSASREYVKLQVLFVIRRALSALSYYVRSEEKNCPNLWFVICQSHSPTWITNRFDTSGVAIFDAWLSKCKIFKRLAAFISGDSRLELFVFVTNVIEQCHG